MKTVLFIFLFFPLIIFSQNEQVFIKIKDASGNAIKGTSVTRGFEYAIEAYTISSSGKNNTDLSFNMPVSGASGLLKSALNNRELLLNADVSVMKIGAYGNLITSYTIRLENIRVITCADNLGCQGNTVTTVTVRAGRIGWAYYSMDKSGTKISISNKTGWDAEKGQPWTNF